LISLSLTERQLLLLQQQAATPSSSLQRDTGEREREKARDYNKTLVVLSARFPIFYLLIIMIIIILVTATAAAARRYVPRPPACR